MQSMKIHQYCNDMQYLDRAKEGSTMKDRLFKAFTKELIKDYGKYEDGTIQCYLSDMPAHIQKEYLKQWLFFEGYLETWEELVANPSIIPAAVEEEKEHLQYWLDEWSDEVYVDFMEARGQYPSRDSHGERVWSAY